jgi:hypothetical protein
MNLEPKSEQAHASESCDDPTHLADIYKIGRRNRRSPELKLRKSPYGSNNDEENIGPAASLRQWRFDSVERTDAANLIWRSTGCMESV